jgi:hypothetical protein
MYKINWNAEKITDVVNLLDAYFSKYPYGESIYQSDSAQTEGLDLLCVISDTIQPEPKNNDNYIHDEWDNTHGDHSIF